MLSGCRRVVPGLDGRNITRCWRIDMPGQVPLGFRGERAQQVATPA